ncbi:peptidoglycan editing factor PgeF [Novosphingobium sp. 9]|uniref:peptidoglycan editing factor PgeF n=1 Tax=Novosphingobium sp. 9 TaxID=2025349 RepID=UPI0021B57AC9|nr:peptidoglycan editing factor PgeF [Novosphingobium sp. 9]
MKSADIDVSGPVQVFQAPCLEGVPHGFLGRRGGVSGGEIAGLNCGLGANDDPALVAENRDRAVMAVAPWARLLGVYQIHSADCVMVGDKPWNEVQRPKADALVVDRPGIVLGILTADCAPVLFADRDAGVVGAAHAGWKGAFAGITDSTIAAMEARGAKRERIVAAVGPCIAQASYEVDSGFRDQFLRRDPATEAFFVAGREAHYQFDLEGFVASQLKRAGIARVEGLGLDTYADPQAFYSYRRATHLGEADYGRQISLIALPQD